MHSSLNVDHPGYPMRSHLLVATDFSTPAKNMIARLEALRIHGAEQITLLYVRRERYPTEDSAGHENYYQALLDDQAKQLRERGWQVEVRNELGRAGSTIVEVGEEVGAELIVMANRGRSAMEDVLLGSVASDVLERSPLPVFLFCDRAPTVEAETPDEPLWNRVIHPTDFSGAADKALDWIPTLVDRQPVPVMLMHVVDDRYYGPREGDERRDKLQKRGQRLDEQGVGDIDRDVIFGRPKKCLSDATEHYPEALFVMGFHGHGWLEDLVLGGVARSIARKATNHLLFVPGSE